MTKGNILQGLISWCCVIRRARSVPSRSPPRCFWGPVRALTGEDYVVRTATQLLAINKNRKVMIFWGSCGIFDVIYEVEKESFYVETTLSCLPTCDVV